MRIIDHGFASGYVEEQRRVGKLEICLEILAGIAILIIWRM